MAPKVQETVFVTDPATQESVRYLPGEEVKAEHVGLIGNPDVWEGKPPAGAGDAVHKVRGPRPLDVRLDAIEAKLDQLLAVRAGSAQDDQGSDGEDILGDQGAETTTTTVVPRRATGK